MTREDRAKQFQPFDAMKGLQEALRDREERHSRTERHDISEEQQKRNNEALAMLEKGMFLRVDCHFRCHDVRLQGYITELNLPCRYLALDGRKLPFEDIYALGQNNSPSDTFYT